MARKFLAEEETSGRPGCEYSPYLWTEEASYRHGGREADCYRHRGNP